ncbi:hypothetical protein ASE48_08620 [Mycobacterium sp. Root265]|uniref:hypothetical protein n=1 Tax=Mycobacterium sp. Root265 TaxID=1736504 RepID=UPI00070D4F51|nr:hypothetical protein [Mycobacterium sp. Root265]KRD08616.1 hypothetical protein ASE48_08620 [Mycobacterium sp. Root265]
MGKLKNHRTLKAGDVAAITGPLRFNGDHENGFSDRVDLFVGEVVDVLDDPYDNDIWVKGRVSGNSQYIDAGSLTRIKFK